MDRAFHIASLALFLCSLLGCTLPLKERTLVTGSLGKSEAITGKPNHFTKAELVELLVRLRPVFEESGFHCTDDGATGGFSIVEGPIHWASYGVVRNGNGSMVGCTIRATKRRLQLHIGVLEEERGTGRFPIMQNEVDAAAILLERIGQFVAKNYLKRQV